MLRNYFAVAFRNLFRNKLTAFINISGLAVAIACGLLIFLFIQDELSYDRYNEKSDRIYRMTREFLSPDGTSNLHLGHLAPPFGPLLKNDFSDFEEVARTLTTRIQVTTRDSVDQQKTINIENGYLAEPSLFNIFTIRITRGNPLNGFDEPYKIMLSEKTAQKLFGDQDPLGKPLRLFNTYESEVTGIFRDFPAQSFWHPSMFISFSTLNDSTIYGKEGLERNWGNNSFGTFVLVKEPFDPRKTETLFPSFLDRHMGPVMAEEKAPMPSTWTRLYLQKMTGIHLHSHLDSEEESNGNISNVYMMGVIGIMIILIACFNFINLSTARATKRSKEVGIRKVSGAYQNQLVLQFLAESVLVSFISLLIASGITFFGLPWLEGFTDKSLPVLQLSNWPLFAGLIIFTLVIGILAGIYPAFVISGFKPVSVLKGQQSGGKAGIRKVLVTAQFVISIMLIVAAAITYQQLNFLNKTELGYDKNQVITLPLYDAVAGNYDAFYNELTGQSSIRNVSRSSRIPTGRLLDSMGGGQVQMGDSMAESSVTIKNIRCDHEFFDTYGIQFASGRNFSKEIKSDDSLGFILNEAAVKMIGLSNEEILTRDFQYGDTKGRVIGVVRDFHFESLREPIVPMVFHMAGNYGRLSIRITEKDMKAAMTHVEKVWNGFIPDLPFEYDFVSERYKNLYQAEQRQGQLFTIFSCLAVMIACLGLFGLATYNTLQRVKEIGIRKVLGASIPDILNLLSREILLLILVANVLAWPVIWYLMKQWLGNFAYRIDVNPLLFLFAGFLTVMLALITIGMQTVKAATSNPVDALRNE